MQKFLVPLLAALAVATPANANEARVEARGGVFFGGGVTQDVWGVAAGYDFDLGDTTFAGVEVSGDKIGTSGTKVAFGATGRLGMKAKTGTRLFVEGGYTTEICDTCEHSIHAGAGFEQDISPNVYGKFGYKHFFVGSGIPDFDAAVVGIGVRF